MRDILVTALVLGLALYTFKRPYVGVLLMSWLGYMNPHRLTWSFAYSMPFALIATGATALALLFTKERTPPPNIFVVRVWFVFILWVSITTLLAFYPADALGEYTRFIKIQVGILFTLMLIRTPGQIKLLVAVIAFSIGFYGIKGGIFTIVTGGNYLVWGPEGSFIQGNNEIALAQLMALPLFYFLFTDTDRRWLKLTLLGCMVLMLAAIVGSHSRGALLGMICTGLFLWWHSKHKLPLAALALMLGLMALPLMPEQWFSRMATIQTYEQDASAMGRINSWTMGTNVALDNFFGGGFGVFWSGEMFARYAPDPLDRHDAHSIYFEILGEQGLIGLLLFLTLWFSTWRLLGRIIAASDAVPAEQRWMADLARMLKVALIAYGSGGAFLGLAYWDLPYHFFAIAVLLNTQGQQFNPEAMATKPGFRAAKLSRRGSPP